MLRRLVARLLLFGIPFCFAYFLTKPTPEPESKTFVLCGYDQEGDDIVIALSGVGCAAPKVEVRRESLESLAPRATPEVTTRQPLADEKPKSLL
jgi:hypothetical protein